jgi:hypothetical protein
VLAGTAWAEVGGDPPWLDEVGMYARLDPTMTSFGPVQMQIRRAAEELGYDPQRLSPAQRRVIIWSLLDPQQNLYIVASHLQRLKNIDAPGRAASELSDDDVRLIGARYNRGAELSRRALLTLGQRTSYGDAIVRRRERVLELLKD